MNTFSMRSLIFGLVVFCLYNLTIIAQTSVTNEEYAVYASVLRDINHENLKENNIKYSFVILNETFKPNFVNDYKSPKMRGLKKNFKLKNNNTANLKYLIPVIFSYQITDKTEIDDFLKIGKQHFEKIEAEYKARNVGIGFDKSEIVWEPFYEKYPKSNGYYQFSRVGFSTDKRFALVHVERESGSSGDSREYVLRKVKGKWKFYSSGGGSWVE